MVSSLNMLPNYNRRDATKLLSIGAAGLFLGGDNAYASNSEPLS